MTFRIKRDSGAHLPRAFDNLVPCRALRLRWVLFAVLEGTSSLSRAGGRVLLEELCFDMRHHRKAWVEQRLDALAATRKRRTVGGPVVTEPQRKC